MIAVMITWMIYALSVSVALSAAALLAERAAKLRRAPTRWIWIASLVGSLVLPTLMATASVRLPEALKSATPSVPIVLRDATSIPMPTALLDLGGPHSYKTSADIDTLLRDAWVAMSALTLVSLALSSALLHRRKRGWTEVHLCGESVLVAPDAGPAVVGLLRSRIVVPQWLLEASEQQQQCTIAHERSHLIARDSQWMALALALLILMPWNAPLWWQFSRLRRAIEVDCDARVLLGGHDIGTYCETLIHVGQQQSSRLAVVPAMSESASFLESRIRHMLRKPKKWARASAAALACLALGVAAFAAQVTPPSIDPHAKVVTLSPDALDRYTGFYQAAPPSVITVTRAGNGLVVSTIAQNATPKPFHLFPLGKNLFGVEERERTVVCFVMDADGHVSRMIVDQAGRIVLNVTRVDQSTAERANATLAAHIKTQKSFHNPFALKAS
jgi:beta-lactamase regulating signal transducer with metallopeptidase domain